VYAYFLFRILEDITLQIVIGRIIRITPRGRLALKKYIRMISILDPITKWIDESKDENTDKPNLVEIQRDKTTGVPPEAQ